MSEAKIYIGKLKKDVGNHYAEGERLYLSKHSWDCGWYWGFGYVGNKDLGAHFDSVFLNDTHTASEIFEEQIFTDSDWWVIRDLFIQAYALKQVAEVYRYGGHQTTKHGITDLIESEGKATEANADLKKVLDKVWEFMNIRIENQSLIKEQIEKLAKRIEKIERNIKDENEKIEKFQEQRNALIKKIKELEKGLQ
jgi:hypothetical protein